MDKILEKLRSDEFLPHKIGLAIGMVTGLLTGMVISDQADNYILEEVDEEVADGAQETD